MPSIETRIDTDRPNRYLSQLCQHASAMNGGSGHRLRARMRAHRVQDVDVTLTVHAECTADSGLQAGMPAPALESLSPEPGRATLLLFLSEGCPPCNDIFQETQNLIGAPPIRVLYSDDAPDVSPPENVLVLPDQGALFESYQISATPFGAIVGADGRIRTVEPVGSVSRLYGLIAETGGRTREEAPAGHDDARLNGSTR